MNVKLVSVLASCLVLQSVVAMQGKSCGQGTRRDLSAYDKAGPYTIDYEPPFRGDKYLGEIRSFLWKYWKEQRRGLVTATFYTIEGDPTTSCYFVEPDAKGAWHIRIDSESIISAMLPKGRKPRREISRDSYDEVDRIEKTSENAANPIVVPKEEVREPQTFRLRLRNKKTNSIRIL